MRILDLMRHVHRNVTAYAGDAVLMQAAIAATANVIVADDEVSSEEFATALAGLRANPILEKGYDLLMLEDALYEAIGRARTRAGRADNLHRVAAIAGRPIQQREDAFLIAADVADHDGIAGVEHAALAEIAAALLVDKARLLHAARVELRPRYSAA